MKYCLVFVACLFFKKINDIYIFKLMEYINTM